MRGAIRAQPNRSRIALLAAATLAIAAGAACRRTERLPTRAEELEGIGDGPAVRPVPAPGEGRNGGPAAVGLAPTGRGAPRRVTFPTPDGVTLVGDWFPSPLGPAAPALLLLHGEHGCRGDWQPLVERLLASPGARASILAIDLRGHGESTAATSGTVRAEELSDDPNAGLRSWSGVVTDAAAALAWLRAQPEVGVKVVIVGVDVGAVAGVRAAAQAPAGPGGIGEVVGLAGLSPAELHGVAWGAETFPALAARGVQGFAVAAEDDTAEPPQGVLAVEAGLGVANTDCEVFRDGGRGLALLRHHPELEGRLLGFLRRRLGATAEFAIPLPDGTALRATADLSLDAGGPVVVLVPEVGRGRASLKKLREVLAERTPYDLVSFDLRSRPATPAAEADGGIAPAGAIPGGPAADGGTAGGSGSLVGPAAEDATARGRVPVGATPAGPAAEDGTTGGRAPVGAEFMEGVPVDDPRSWWQLVRDVEQVVRAVTVGGGLPAVDGGVPVPRSAWALVGLGFGGTLAVTAAGNLVGDAALPPLAAVALVSPVANSHGITLWEPLGNRLRPTGLSVFAAAGARAAMSAPDLVDGLGSQAKTARSIGTMFRDRAAVRLYTSEAHAEQLIHVHADLAPAMAEFLYARVEDALRHGLTPVTGPAPSVEAPARPWAGAEPSSEEDAGAPPALPLLPERMRLMPALRPNWRIPLDTLHGPRIHVPPSLERP